MLNIFKEVDWVYQSVFWYDLVYTPVEMNLIPNQEVPWRTPWYNYTKNFVCIDVESEKLAKLVVFRDGKYKETIKYDEGQLYSYSDIILDSDKVIDENGNKLNIQFRSQLYEYVNNRQEWLKTKHKIQEEYDSYGEVLVNKVIETVKSKDYNCELYLDFVGLDMHCDYGAYLHLVATSDKDRLLEEWGDELLKSALFCMENECPVSLQEYFTWNDTPVTERSALAKAYEKIMKIKGGEE